jgi:hypothetical protein
MHCNLFVRTWLRATIGREMFPPAGTLSVNQVPLPYEIPANPFIARFNLAKRQEAVMPDLKWLEGYNGETTDELIGMEGRCRTDSLVVAFEQAIEQKSVRVGDDRLTIEERVILAVEALEREVNNGGYDQFFINSSRGYAPIIVDALRRIGCPRTAEITQRAVAIMQRFPISDEEIDGLEMEENEERQSVLEECDASYFEASEDIAESLFAYIKANRAKIKP